MWRTNTKPVHGRRKQGLQYRDHRPGCHDGYAYCFGFCAGWNAPIRWAPYKSWCAHALARAAPSFASTSRRWSRGTVQDIRCRPTGPLSDRRARGSTDWPASRTYWRVGARLLQGTGSIAALDGVSPTGMTGRRPGAGWATSLRRLLSARRETFAVDCAQRRGWPGSMPGRFRSGMREERGLSAPIRLG